MIEERAVAWSRNCVGCGAALPRRQKWCDACRRKERQARWREYYRANAPAMRLRTKATKLRDRGSTEELAQATLILANDPCSYCGKRGGTLDHIDPTAGNGWDNLTSACASCNRYKQRTPLLLFLLAHPMLEERDRLHRQLIEMGVRRGKPSRLRVS